MPVRDEESESQRKARSRLMRQSRRSTQGVTLTDLKEAEKVAGKVPEPEQPALPSLDPSRRPRVPGVENAEGPAQRGEVCFLGSLSLGSLLSLEIKSFVNLGMESGSLPSREGFL